MDEKKYKNLEEVITDELFPEVDHKLRSGWHFGLEEVAHYEFLEKTLPKLNQFYAGYRCRLASDPEGYFYLVSDGDLMGQRRLTAAEMLAGQTLALLSLDPVYLQDRGRIPKDHVLGALEKLVEREQLLAVVAPRARAGNRERDAQRIREEVGKALFGLTRMGFIKEFREEGTLLPRKAILRFAAPVRDSGDWRANLEKLIQSGQVDVENDEQEPPS